MTIVTSINVSISSEYYFYVNIIVFFLYLPKVVFPSTKNGKRCFITLIYTKAEKATFCFLDVKKGK